MKDRPHMSHPMNILDKSELTHNESSSFP
jgi:hypothetical protein